MINPKGNGAGMDYTTESVGGIDSCKNDAVLSVGGGLWKVPWAKATPFLHFWASWAMSWSLGL